MSIEKFRELATEANRDYRNLVVDAGRGDEIDPSDAQRVATLAGRSMDDLAKDVERACQRFDAHAAYHGRDWSAEIAAAKAERTTAIAAKETAEAELDVATAKFAAAKAVADTASARMNDLVNDRDRTGRELAATLRATGHESDPADLRLHDEPTPKRDAWRDDPDLRIDLGGGSQVRPLASNAGIAL